MRNCSNLPHRPSSTTWRHRQVLRTMGRIVQQVTRDSRASSRFMIISNAWAPSMLSPANQQAVPLTSAFSHGFFDGATGDEFVEQSLASFGAQHAAQALNVLAPGAVAADDNSHPAICHVHAFIQHTSRDQFAILTRAETFQDGTPFLGGRLICVIEGLTQNIK